MADTSWKVEAAAAGQRLDRYLAEPGRLGSRSRAAAAIERGKVFVNGADATLADASLRLVEGDEIRLWMDRPGSAHTRMRPHRVGALDIRYDDASVVVVNKPAGLLTVPLPRSEMTSALELLARGAGRGRGPLAVHRIDRDTSGLVVFAKTRDAQAALKEQFARREPERVYLAIVHGNPSPVDGTWRDHLVWDADDLVQQVGHARQARAAEAVTHYSVLEEFERAALLEVRLETGKRNQIRVQAAEHGHPLVGERQYGTSVPVERIPFPRQALHAARLSFAHPIDDRRMRFEAPLPTDLRKLMAMLRGR